MNQTQESIITEETSRLNIDQTRLTERKITSENMWKHEEK